MSRSALARGRRRQPGVWRQRPPLPRAPTACASPLALPGRRDGTWHFVQIVSKARGLGARRPAPTAVAAGLVSALVFSAAHALMDHPPTPHCCSQDVYEVGCGYTSSCREITCQYLAPADYDASAIPPVVG